MNKLGRIAALILAGQVSGAAWAFDSAVCDWNTPGANPFNGSPLFAVMGYSDIPMWPRLVLATRAGFGVTPTDYAGITRGFIHSSVGIEYSARLTDMYFGNGVRCGLPLRGQWASERIEPARVWCYDTYCVGIVDICKNVTRFWPSNFPRNLPRLDEPLERAAPLPLTSPGGLGLLFFAVAGALLGRFRNAI